MTHGGCSATSLRQHHQFFALVGDTIFMRCGSCKCDQRIHTSAFLLFFILWIGLQQAIISVIYQLFWWFKISSNLVKL